MYHLPNICLWADTLARAGSSEDPVALGQWWAQVLGWIVLNDSHEEFEIRPAADRLPGLVFVPVPEAKRSKNRLHLDFRPEDQQAEVEVAQRGELCLDPVQIAGVGWGTRNRPRTEVHSGAAA
jgi:hypothetical protein